jgi:hypothetical protein
MQLGKSLLTQLGWASCVLVLGACSGKTRIKDVGDLPASSGSGGGDSGGSDSKSSMSGAGGGGHVGTAGSSVGGTGSGGHVGTAGSSAGGTGGAPACDHETPAFCSGNDIFTCRANGTQVLDKACPVGRHCAVVDAVAECAANLCAPDADACIENRLGVCGADGASLSSVTDDCAAQGQICNPARACSDSAVDTLGPAGDSTISGKGNSISGNLIDVCSDRLITSMQARLKLDAPTQGAFLIYELVGGKYVLRLDDVGSFEPAADAVFSSHALNFKIYAGRRYTFAIYLATGACFENQAAETDVLSFGHVLGSSFSGGGDYHDADEFGPGFGAQFDMRISTAPAP